MKSEANHGGRLLRSDSPVPPRPSRVRNGDRSLKCLSVDFRAHSGFVPKPTCPPALRLHSFHDVRVTPSRDRTKPRRLKFGIPFSARQTGMVLSCSAFSIHLISNHLPGSLVRLRSPSRPSVKGNRPIALTFSRTTGERRSPLHLPTCDRPIALTFGGPQSLHRTVCVEGAGVNR